MFTEIEVIICGRDDGWQSSASVQHNEAKVGFKPHEKVSIVCVSPWGSVRFASALCSEWIRAAEWARDSLFPLQQEKYSWWQDKKKIPAHAIMPSARAFNEKRGKLPKLNRLTVVSPEAWRKIIMMICFFFRIFIFFWNFPYLKWSFLIFQTDRGEEFTKKAGIYYYFMSKKLYLGLIPKWNLTPFISALYRG